jgi:hypothetical protein
MKKSIITDINVEIELQEPMLGTVPKNKEVYAKYIATKAPTPENGEEEIQTVEEIEEGGWTGFHVDEEGLFCYNYMFKGQIKAGLEVMIESKAIPPIPAYKKWCDRMIHIYPRRVRFCNGDGKPLTKPDGVIERPLRAMTPKGERVTVTRSDVIDVGRRAKLNIRVLNNTKKLNPKAIKAAMEYGEFYGLGQWRGSGGYGRYWITSWEVAK